MKRDIRSKLDKKYVDYGTKLAEKFPKAKDLYSDIDTWIGNDMQ